MQSHRQYHREHRRDPEQFGRQKAVFFTCVHRIGDERNFKCPKLAFYCLILQNNILRTYKYALKSASKIS
jgi:hypothetical protein